MGKRWMWLCCILSSTLLTAMSHVQAAAAATTTAVSSSTRAKSRATIATDTVEEADDIDVWPHMRHYDIWNALSHSSSTKVKDPTAGNSIAYDDEPSQGMALDDEPVEPLEPVEMVHQSIGDWYAGDGQNASNANRPLPPSSSQRNGRVLSIFPVPGVDGECSSEDGRRTGSCLNAYVCRAKGGLARGDCALGFGVCCIFVSNCNTTIVNNITYLVSPNFPSFMSDNVTSCSFRVQLMSEDISQLRIDFQHFSLGQPNRRTGVCDSDAFSVSGGPGGTFTLCGQNSGQHIYYDVLTRPLSRQALYGNLRPLTYEQLYANFNASTLLGYGDGNGNGNGNAPTEATGQQAIEITMNFTKRYLPIRLWEIRISQIPFSQRAPAGCLQFHTGAQGVIQTFNYAENGRHLANQRYRICMRQEAEMCSIIYEPCDEQSFRIGPSSSGINGMGGGVRPGGGASMLSLMMSSTTMPTVDSMLVSSSTASNVAESTSTQATSPRTSVPTTTTTVSSTAASMTTSTTTKSTTTAATTTTMTPASTTVRMATSTNATTPMPMPTTVATTTPSSTSTATTTSTTTSMPPPSTTALSLLDEATTTVDNTSATTTTTTSESPDILWDDVEGSGDDEEYVYQEDSWKKPIRRKPRPIRGGFDLLGFLRNAFDFRLRHRRRRRRGGRQFFSTCNDRITLPCIIEDFIGAGLGPLPGCEPIHCGAQFCSTGVWPCRIESTVTPFYIGVNFGSGIGKGSAEDNIGACLRYSQVQCL